MGNALNFILLTADIIIMFEVISFALADDHSFWELIKSMSSDVRQHASLHAFF